MTPPFTGPRGRILRMLALGGVLVLAGSASAQRTKYWVGGSGAWSDAAHWSLTAGGPGGAGGPHANEDVLIVATESLELRIDADADAHALIIDASHAAVDLGGSRNTLHVTGDMRLKGSVHWRFSGPLELDLRGGLAELDPRGIPLAGDVTFTGGGTWSMISDLVLGDEQRLALREGTLVTNGNLLRTGTLAFEGHRTKRLVANTSVVMAEHAFEPGDARGVVDAGTSRLVVNGGLMPWGAAAGAAEDDMRAINICGTGPGQTLFTINAQLVSNYNGFGVSCHAVCNGTVHVSVTGGVGPFFYTWIGGPSGAGASTWNNVCPGNQIVIVTDQGQGVSCATTVQVTDPALLSVIFFGNQPPTCAEVCNGVSNAFAVGGVPTYSYVWTSGAGTGPSFNQLCPGINTLHVTDANLCAFDTMFNFTVLPISPNLSSNNASCAGDCNGTAHAAPTGGTGTYTYDWQPGTPTGDGTNTVSNLCAGSYSVTIADANGCDTTVTFTITAPPPIIPNPAHLNATCSNTCNGSATVAPSGTTGPYTFNWAPTPGGGQGTAAVTGLCAGVYTCTITDVPTGCDTVVTFTITAPPPIDPHFTSTNALCHGSCDGTAIVAPTGGTPGYTYLWAPAPPTGQGTPSVSGLCAGNWSVTVTDAANCDTVVTFTITQPPPIDPAPTHTNVTCASLCNGTATVAPTGGTGTFTYDWQPGTPTGDGTNTVSNLCAGNYSVLITDVNGCDTTVSFTITEPPPLAATTSQTNVTCGSSCDGTATITVSGGTPGYTYVWTPAPAGGQGTPTATGLCAGPISVTVTDANGCTLTRNFTILPAVPLVLSLNLTPASCPGVCDGTAGIIVTGGTPGYTYTWSPAPGTGQGTPNVTGLCPQAYSLTIADAVGCDTTISFTITAPAPIVPNEVVTNATCARDCNGSIVLAPTGGSGVFTYTWSPVPLNGQGDAQATGLCAGSYQVIITSGACDTMLSVTITAPPPIVPGLSVTNATCAGDCNGTATANTTGGTPGYTYTWAPAPGAGQGTLNATGLCAGNYTLTIADAAGCDTLVPFTILAPAPIAPHLTVTNADCGSACNGSATVAPTGGTPGYTYNWTPAPGAGQGTATATGLCPGAWSVTITDAALCDTTVSFTISTPPPITVTPVVTPASCANTCDGTITLAPTGGLPPYTYTWSPTPGAGQGTSHVTGLCPGDWTVTISDLGGCDTTLTINVGSPTPILPNGTFTDESCNGPCDGTGGVAPTGGSGTYSFLWSPSPPAGQGTPNVSGLCAGNWSVTITDSGGCDTTWSFTVSPVVPVDAQLTVQNNLCAGECLGEATVVASGGVGSYTYDWQPPPPAGQGTDHASGLCAGNYQVTVADLAGCDTTITFTITTPTALQPDLTVTGESCAGPCTGVATVTTIGGTGTYTYDWQPAPGGGQGTATATGLCAGVNYQVTIADANGCDSTLAFTVPAFDPIAPVLTIAPATCAGACNGSVLVSISGGQPPYTRFWSPPPPNGQGAVEATGLCPGDITLTITDANGCDTTLTITITAPPPLDVSATVTPARCASQCNGAIDVLATGGTGALTYDWTPAPPTGQGTANVGDLCAGDYAVTITDANGCDTTITYTITEPAPLAATTTMTGSHCGVCDGSLTLHVTGGTRPYTFSWGPPVNVTTTDSTQTGLCAGFHVVTITDANGCVLTRSFAVSDSDGETITVTDGTTTCPSTCDGQVSVTFTCTLGPCSIAWADLAGNDLGQSGNTLTDLCPGGYIVSVTNGSGCISIDTATVIAPAGLDAAISSTPVSCANSCDGTATIGLTGGVGPFLITWDPPPGGGQGTPHATGLCPGVYSIIVDDLGGCDSTFSVLITAPPPITVDAAVTDMHCSGTCDGSIVLTPQGGTGAYTYLWSPVPPNGPGTASATSLCAGDYTVTVGDANGCDTTITYTIAEPPALTLTPSTAPSHCTVCDGSATLVIAGGTGAVDVTWTDAGGTTVGTGPSLTGLCAGVYTAIATDVNGCTTSVVVAITDASGETLTMTDGQTLCANACDAQVGVTFLCSIAPCTITWYDADANILAQDAFTLTDLCTGLYIVQVTNGGGCSTIDTAFVTPSQVILPNLSSTPVSCADACDGSATVGPTGGVDPYTFNWSPEPGGGQGTPQATGLCPGVYEVLIADASGCDTLVSVLINAPPPIAVDALVNDVTCNSACDGSIVLTPGGGNGFFGFTWSPVPSNGQGSNSALGLCAGDWTVTVADINGCDTTITYTIAEPAPLALAITSAPSDCGVCTGQASVQASGGTAPYLYSWTLGPAVYGTDSALTDLCAGLYTITVTDAHNCTAQLQVPISDVNGEVVSTTGDLLTCPGVCDGDVSASFVCGIPVCTVAWFDGAGNDLGQSSTTVTDLCAGIYFVQVTNGSGCITIDSAVVASPPPIVANLSTTPATCAGRCDGTATVGPTGGAGNYTYHWDPEPGAGQDTPSASGLCAGTYQVTITDASGCSITQDVLITEPLPIDATAVIGTITCNGACDGSITVMPTGGSGSFTFSWSPEPGAGQNTSTVTGLCAGDWNVTIADVNGCDTTFTVTLTDPPVLVVDLVTTDNVCHGDCSGTAGITISGGGSPYTITWSDVAGNILGSDVTSISGLCAGDYTVEVRDANGCIFTQDFTIGQGNAIDAALVVQGETCHGPCDGTASVTPSGGSGAGYVILWQPEPGGGQGTTTATGLCQGDWSVTITDGGGCDTTIAFHIDSYHEIEANGVILNPTCNAACNGSIDLTVVQGIGTLTYVWSPEPPNGQGTPTITDLCAGPWSLTVTDAALCDTTITITLIDPPTIDLTVDAVTDASCNTASDGAIAITVGGGSPGYTIGWSGPDGFTSDDEDLTGLAPGDYTVTVTDDNSCTITQTITVGAENSVVADAGDDRTECNGAGITLDGSGSQGGTSYEWRNDQGDLIGTDAVVNIGGLSPGTYTFTLVVSDGPCVDTDVVTIEVLASPVADAGPDQTLFVQGTVTLGGQPSGPSGATFAWMPDTLVSDVAAPNPTGTVNATTWFVLTVQDPNGCADVDSVLITVVPEVRIPSGFTPNGDGHNDVWQIDFIELFPECEVEIYNRWGQPLFRSVGYREPWDGRYQGGFVPVGTYYYAIKLNDPRFPDAFTGPLTVIR